MTASPLTRSASTLWEKQLVGHRAPGRCRGCRTALRQGPALQLGVTVEEMRQASMALMQLVPTEPTEVQKGRDLGRDERGRDRKSDEERLAATGT